MIISVIIPCRNEEKHIASCIDAVFANELDDSDSIEVLVVDGMSDDNTRSLLSNLQQRYNTLRVIENKRKVTPVAFNLGINASIGDFIQIVGARQIISKNYLRTAKQTMLDNDQIWCVGGRVQNVYQNEESEIIGLAMSSPFGVGGGNFRVTQKSCYTDTVGTPMYSRKVIEKIGLFNEDLIRNQDDEYNYRVIRAGGKIYLNVDIDLQYFVRASIKNLYKQYFQYGYWKVYVNRLHKTITTVRQLIPLFFVLGIILGFISSFIIPFFYLLYFLGLLAYLILGVYFAIKVTKKSAFWHKIIIVFIILHWSYGFGYLRGLIDFYLLNRKPAAKNTEISR
jgi:glycosyltransferase involved in cell wall biosynthesis